jgi:hypothetical protein
MSARDDRTPSARAARASGAARRGARALALLALLAALGGCRTLRDVFTPAPVGSPSGREGWVVYPLRDLRFEAPVAWQVSGGERRLTLEAPDGKAKLEVTYAGVDFADEKACLAAAEEKLRQQQGTLERARRHATRLAGRPAHALEGDQGAWHVRATAACDGGVQYRVFFTAATPASREALEVHRTFLQSARIGGEV